MAALNFPASPSDGDTYTPVGSNITYTYSSAKGSWKGNVGSSAATNTLTSTLVATNTTDATHYPVFVNSATGNEEMRTDTGLTYNPSTGLLSAASFAFSGALNVDGNATLGDATTDEHTINGSLIVVSTTNEQNVEIKTTFGSKTNNSPDFGLYNNSTQSGNGNNLGVIQFFSDTANYTKFQFADIIGMALQTGNAATEGGIKYRFSNGASQSWGSNREITFRPEKIQYYNGTSTTTLAYTTPTAGDVTITLPNTTGTVALTGKQTMWIPAAAMYPREDSGCAALTKVDLGTNVPDLNVLDFDPSSDEFAEFSVAFPKAWNAGTVTFQAYFTVAGTNAGTVKWELGGLSFGDNDSLSATYGSPIGPAAKAHSGTAHDLNITAESGAVTIANAAADELVYFRIFRDVSDDTQTGDARLIGIKLFFTTDKANDE